MALRPFAVRQSCRLLSSVSMLRPPLFDKFLKKGRLSSVFLAPKVTIPLPSPAAPARAFDLPFLATFANPFAHSAVKGFCSSLFARMIQVRHRSHATYSRQPRQVRKEATVTGSCVCSGPPVPGLFSFRESQTNCHPERRLASREAERKSESKDPSHLCSVLGSKRYSVTDVNLPRNSRRRPQPRQCASHLR